MIAGRGHLSPARFARPPAALFPRSTRRRPSGSSQAPPRTRRELLPNRALLDEMGHNARRMIDERFLWPRVVEQIENIYATVCNETVRATPRSPAAA